MCRHEHFSRKYLFYNPQYFSLKIALKYNIPAYRKKLIKRARLNVLRFPNKSNIVSKLNISKQYKLISMYQNSNDINLKVFATEDPS